MEALSGLQIHDTVQRGQAAMRHSLSSIRWNPMEERAGERRWPPLSSVLSPLLRRGARKKNPRCEKSSRLATISTDTDRLQVCATNGAAACFGGSIKIRPLRAAAQSLLSQGWELPDNFGRIEKN